MSELLPCPFCGQPGQIFNRTTGEGQQFVVICLRGSCSVRGLWCYEEADAIASWNTRHAAPVVISEDAVHKVIQAFFEHVEIEEGVPVACLIEPIRSALEAALLPLPLPPKDKK